MKKIIAAIILAGIFYVTANAASVTATMEQSAQVDKLLETYHGLKEAARKAPSAKQTPGQVEAHLKFMRDMQDMIIKEDAIAVIAKRRDDERTIQRAIVAAFIGESPSPENAWNIILTSTIDGTKKIEMLRFFKEFFPNK